MNDLPIINCSHDEFLNLQDEEVHGMYITEVGTFYYVNGKRHREDGPAIEIINGDKRWYFNDLKHREDGPAVELNHGYKAWFFKGKLHRLNGPAVLSNDRVEYWINDEEYSKKEYEIEIYIIDNGLESYG